MTEIFEGIRVLDLSRVLAGPLLAQNMADLGADVIKVERPGHGDESRSFPPFLKDREDKATEDSAYFCSINRGKRSITVDIAKEEGQAIVKRLAARADVVVENYKVGTLARYGLDYSTIHSSNPGVIYCSITGFGQTGPYRQRPGYDYLFQAMSGLMSLTGQRDDLPGGGPAKVGVAICDVITGIQASFAVAAALFHRQRTGEGQYIDMSLLDTTIAAISHINMNFLMSGKIPERMGTAHPSIVPYQAFFASDGPFVIAVGNDGQFKELTRIVGLHDLACDARFRTNVDRVQHREALIPQLAAAFAPKPVAYWLERLGSSGVPCGPINNLKQVFEDPQVRSRGMRMELDHPRAGKIPFLSNPMRFSATPATYRRVPPTLGEHTGEILRDELGYDEQQIIRLSQDGIV